MELALHDCDQGFVGLRIPDVPLPLAFGVLLHHEHIVTPQVAGSTRFTFAPDDKAHNSQKLTFV